MIRNKGALGALLLSFVLSAFITNVNARIQFDAFGGELEMEGFLKSETRTHMFAGKTHMGQWIQKFQLLVLGDGRCGFLSILLRHP